MSVYRFDPEKEPDTVKIRAMPWAYVAIEKLEDGEYKRHLIYPTENIVLDINGSKKREWNYNTAEMWVPPRIANQLAIKPDDASNKDWSPIVSIVESRDKPTVDKLTTDAPPVRRQPAASPV